MLRLEVQHHPQFTVLRCSGRIVHGDGADTLLQAVMELPERHVHIDLVNVDAIDASGLGVLVRLEKWANDGNRMLHLTNVPKRVQEAIETTKLTTVLQLGEHAEDFDDAA